MGLSFWHAKLTRAVVQELAAANWPALTLFSSVEMPLDMGILSLLSQAHWPQLAYMSLANWRLLSTQEQMEREMRILPTVSNLLSSVIGVRSRKLSSSKCATFDWCSIITLDLTYQQVDTQMVTHSCTQE